jgi:hypothetical protein
LNGKPFKPPGLALLLAFVLSSCQVSGPVPPLGDLTPCQPVYCWQGAQLQTLHYAEIEDRIRSLPDFEQAKTGIGWTVEDLASQAWISPRKTLEGEPQWVGVVFKDGRATSLSRSFSPLTLRTVVRQFGEPSHVLVHNSGPPSHMLVSMTIIYAPQGILFYSDQVPNRHREAPFRYKITPGLKIWDYTLGSSSDLEQLMYDDQLNSGWPPDDTTYTRAKLFAQQAQPWKGYGDYEVALIKWTPDE